MHAARAESSSERRPCAPSGRLRPAAALVVLGVLLAAPAGASPEGPALEYLTIRANEGGSSGGHAAIRIDDEVFHFQNESGILVMQREESRSFQHRYRTLENRDVELSRIPVSEETFELLRAAFARRYLAQQQHLEILRALRADRALLSLLREDAAGRRELELPVRGAGFFFGPATDASRLDPVEASARSNSLLELADRIAVRHGSSFVSSRRRALRSALADLRPIPSDVGAQALDPDGFVVLPDTFSRRYTQLVQGWLALDVLSRGRPLRRQTTLSGRAGPDDPFALAPEERARVSEAREALLDRLTELVASRRPDWGDALLLGMARLAALEATLREGRLVLLDALPAGADRLRISHARRAHLPSLRAETLDELRAARAGFFAGIAFEETEYGALEEAATRSVELDRAFAADEIRVESGVLVPEGRGTIRRLPRPRGVGEWLDGTIAQARAVERRYARALRPLYAYDLLRRNCVTELFRAVDSAFTSVGERPRGSRDRARRESTARLGGHLLPGTGLGFIPFVAAHNVRRHYSVSEQVTLPSYRHHRLALEAHETSPLRLALRESNVITSEIHQTTEGQGFFLFYTEDQVAVRPLLGLLNLASAAGRSALGLLQVPIDRGRGLRSGIEGMLFSVPELFFQNIRKGSNDYVAPALRPPPG